MATFVFKIGHETVEVDARDYDAAVKKARLKLTEKWPHHWDMIMEVQVKLLSQVA